MDYVILSMIIIAFIITVYFAFVMRDTKYIKKHWIPFILETILIGVVTVFLFICIYHLRKINMKLKDYIHFIGGAFFFMLIHVLFELCGLYHKL